MKRLVLDLLRIMIILCVLSTIYVFSAGLIISGIFTYNPSYEKAENCLTEDIESLNVVIDYIVDNRCEEFFINDTENTNEYFSGLENGHVKINDENTIKAIDYLMNSRSYNVICKSNGTIYFQRWCRIDAGSGLAYKLYGDTLDIGFLIYSKSMSKDNWYYYEEDFNKWKSMQ